MSDILMMSRAKPERAVVQPELLTVEQTAMMTSLGVRTIWTLTAKGEFPRPVAVGKAARWKRSAVMAWIEGLQEE
jgi:excisionase family DNA binding protein